MRNRPVSSTQGGPATGGRHRAALLVLAALLAPLTTIRLYGSDEIQYFAYLRSVVFDGDLDFSDEYRWFVDRDPKEYAGFAETFLRTKTRAGRAPNNAPIGCAVLWAPFYLAALGAERSLAGVGDANAAGYSRLDVAAVCFASMLYGVIGLFLTQEICRRFAPPPAAFWATVLVWFGTSLVFYMYAQPPMSHACSFFAAALLLWLWLRPSRGLAGAVLIGLAGGLAASVRWQDGLLLSAPLAAPLLAGEVRDRSSAGRWIARSLVIAAAAAAAFLPQLLVWESLNGALTPYGVIGVGGRFSPAAPQLVSLFVSPFHGLLVWSPILLPAFAGLVVLAVADGRGRALALAVALELYLLAGYAVAFGHGFGQRLFVGALPAAAAGLAALCAWIAATRALRPFAAAAALAVWWNLSLVVQYGTGMIPRDRGVDLATLVRNQLVRVPALLPDVARRYVFARGSLYHVDPQRSPHEAAP